MVRFSRVLIVLPLLLVLSLSINAQRINTKKAYAAALKELTSALLKRQVVQKEDAQYGAIQCAHCNVLHTRAAEAVYPFAIMYKISGDEAYLKAALATANWLMKQQEKDGSWKETPEEWKGTTTDQLLMLLLAYESLSPKLKEQEKTAWKTAMNAAADFLFKNMTPEFASINYVATTTATLAKAGQFFGNNAYSNQAQALAHRTVSKMDEDGFINGEGGRSYKNKQGVDLGYDMEMSLWGLGLYARLTADTLVDGYVKRALKNHVYFIYPDGSLDGSWGIRSNKWTGYGSATSDGCQVLFSMYADEDPVYASASMRNLQFLMKNKAKDLIGFGQHHEAVFDTPPCIYPTFAKAKNIAMAYELEKEATRELTALHSDKIGWMKLFPTLDVVEVRTENFMATITGYRYKDPAGTKGKYMYRPTGGAVSYLWMKDLGFLQASSPTVYTRPEPMSFPEAPGTMSLTPRIEYTDSLGYFTNLFEFDSRLTIDSTQQGHYGVHASGELKDKNQLAGGVGYTIDYLFTNNTYQKTIQLSWHDAWPAIKIVEPFVDAEGATFNAIDDRTVIINTGKKKLKFELVSGNAKIILGRNRDKFWTPYPALKAFPIELEVTPAVPIFKQTISYKVSVIQ
ncbi:hypothetical protein [Flavisolibacter tropicus]|uniref:Uncharacterized protein n=1 Tax=Flavisolibacter tropicus TaxID=1492898 RepID=A0A172TXM4_9BACT|nr:hypothetical protein [Flavisolibacter tropicus]ANE51487.1 hypothetical protein SY85_14210 [Flavisolibacter tropicus]